MGQSWILSSLCLHAISERWKQRQDQAERARPHFPQRRRGVLQPADASKPPRQSRRGVSLICAVNGSRALCRVVKSPRLTPEALRQDQDVLDSGFIVGLQARVWTHPLQYGQPAHDEPGESKCRLATKSDEIWSEQRALHNSSVFYTCVNEQKFQVWKLMGFGVDFSVIHIKNNNNIKLGVFELAPSHSPITVCINTH